MESNTQIQNTNSRFSALCDEARVWLADQVRQRGYECSIEHTYLITSKTDAATRLKGEARVSIYCLMQRFSRMAKGIRISVNRSRHPIHYNRETENWRSFPWDKIIKTHLAEVDLELKRLLEYRHEHTIRESLDDLAESEVPIPVDFLRDFRRSRNQDGTYYVNFKAQNLTADETRTLRDIAVAAHTRAQAAQTNALTHDHVPATNPAPTPA